METSLASSAPLIAAALKRHSFSGFAAFGLFWGVWGASIPRIRDDAGITDGQLGAALLFVGAGALPAMLLTGRMLDRLGLWVTGPLLLVLGFAGIGIVVAAPHGLAALCTASAIVGAMSGAADVGLNALAGRAEQAAERAIITPAHGVFSTAVVAGTLSTGAAGALSMPVMFPFTAAVMGATVAFAVVMRDARLTRLPSAAERSVGANAAAAAPQGRGVLPLGLLIGIGMLGMLAFASENAHQSWSAAFLEDELAVPVGLSAFGPALFAAVVAVTRFSVARVPSRHARSLVVVGAIATASGTAGLAAAPVLPVALVALTVAAAGTAVLFPTLLGFVSRAVPEGRRGQATSIVTFIAYTGYVAGPPFVGILSGFVGLRGAMAGVAALAALLALTAPLLRKIPPKG